MKQAVKSKKSFCARVEWESAESLPQEPGAGPASGGRIDGSWPVTVSGLPDAPPVTAGNWAGKI
jgi:hypothetical protein